eukprot:13819764-Alexandrium_andersonii.AAC.1
MVPIPAAAGRPREAAGQCHLCVAAVEGVPHTVGHPEPVRAQDGNLVALHLGPHVGEQPVHR